MCVCVCVNTGGLVSAGMGCVVGVLCVLCLYGFEGYIHLHTYV